MLAALRPLKPDEPVAHRAQLLRQLADTLGVGISAFHENSARHLFHTADDGTQWFIVSTPNGRPAVRRVDIAASGNGTGDEPIDQFVAKNLKTSQGLALAALIDRLMLTCLR